MSTRKRRDGRYPHRLGVHVSAETFAALTRASERFGVAVGSLARAALERGLHSELESRRKSARSEGR